MFHLQMRIAIKSFGRNSVFAGDERVWRGYVGDFAIGFLDDDDAARFRGADKMQSTVRKIGIAAWSERMMVFAVGYSDGALGDKQKSLHRGETQFSSLFHLRGVLGKPRSHGRASVYDRHRAFHSRQRCAHKRIGGEQHMIRLVRTSRMTKIMHGPSSREIRWIGQVAQATAVHRQSLLQCPR